LSTAGAIYFFTVAFSAGLLLLAQPARSSEEDREAVLELADRIFDAARARDAKRFASFFSDDPPCVYVINLRTLRTRAAVEQTFSSLLERQRRFDPRWGERSVQLLTPTIGILTGAFATTAQRVSGEPWEAAGTVTFVAMKARDGWRVVNWHTSE
jgi:uncharacterized protein (TIGR02246 family)